MHDTGKWKFISLFYACVPRHAPALNARAFFSFSLSLSSLNKSQGQIPHIQITNEFIEWACVFSRDSRIPFYFIVWLASKQRKLPFRLNGKIKRVFSETSATEQKNCKQKKNHKFLVGIFWKWEKMDDTKRKKKNTNFHKFVEKNYQ